MTGLPLRVELCARPARARSLAIRCAGGSSNPARRMRSSGSRRSANAPPDWLDAVPAIVLARVAMPQPERTPQSSIPVGRPGRDHDGVVYDRATGTLVEVRRSVAEQRCRALPKRLDAHRRRREPAMIRLKGGRVIDPKNGRDAVGDVWIDGERIVDAPEGRQRRRDLRRDRQDRHGGRHRHPLAYRQRQREHLRA